MKLSSAERAGLSQMFSKLGRLGGIARATKLTPEERSAVALRAALTRWRNQEKKAVQHGFADDGTLTSQIR